MKWVIQNKYLLKNLPAVSKRLETYFNPAEKPRSKGTYTQMFGGFCISQLGNKSTIDSKKKSKQKK